VANQILDISMITNEALFVLENELTFANLVTREYDDKFAVSGAKIGYTVNVRKPARYIGTLGPNLNVEDFYEGSIPVTLTTQFHVDTQFTTADLLLALDEFSDRVIKPGVAAIANKIDFDMTTLGYLWTGNAVGVPGTPLTSRLPFLQAGAILDSEAAPRDGKRAMVMDQWTHSYVVDALAGLFNPQTQIGEQYKKGLIGKNTLGLDFYMDQNIVSYTPGSGAGTPVVSGAGQGITSGWTQTGQVLLSGFSNSTRVLNVGDIVTFAGCYAVNPQNRATYGGQRLRQFVVRPFNGSPSAGTYTSTSATGAMNAQGYYTSSGSGTLQIQVSPAIITSGQFQNVSAAPTNGGAVTVFGSSSVVSPQNMAFHKMAFTLCSADLELPEGVHFAGRAADPQTGLSIRIVRQYTINNDSIPARFDVLYGGAPIYNELACRVAG
jgi:P22 coat protein - gene protein 5